MKAPSCSRAPAAHLARRKMTVLVLNGNGRQGAAASTAARVSHHGYRIGGVANAPRSDFTRSLVMYRKGFEGEGRRLARDLGIRIVGPLDGLRTSQLHGAHAVSSSGRKRAGSADLERGFRLSCRRDCHRGLRSLTAALAMSSGPPT